MADIFSDLFVAMAVDAHFGALLENQFNPFIEPLPPFRFELSSEQYEVNDHRQNIFDELLSSTFWQIHAVL